MEPSDRKSILTKIAETKKQITELHQQQKAAETRLQSLQEHLAQYDDKSACQTTASSNTPIHTATNLTPEEKVTLFRSLFRGRDDIYPKLWQNRKSGKKGYSPACSNEWIRGVCEKPRIKCSNCTHQAFLPVTPDVILAHLQGHHIIGIYPMLKDETCWFLAADFDKEAWQEDVIAFTETCRHIGITYAIER